MRLLTNIERRVLSLGILVLIRQRYQFVIEEWQLAPARLSLPHFRAIKSVTRRTKLIPATLVGPRWQKAMVSGNLLAGSLG